MLLDPNGFTELGPYLGPVSREGGGHGKRTFSPRYSLDFVDALDVIVADIPTEEIVSKAVKATPPVVAEPIGTDLGQF